jgi:hypothetical protein
VASRFFWKIQGCISRLRSVAVAGLLGGLKGGDSFGGALEDVAHRPGIRCARRRSKRYLGWTRPTTCIAKHSHPRPGAPGGDVPDTEKVPGSVTSVTSDVRRRAP